MRKNCFLFLLLVSLLVVLTACGAKVPSNNELIAMIPDDILNYSLDGEYYTSSVSSLELIRQQVDEKIVISDCKLLLEDDYTNRTEYITMTSKYWDKGGWMLEGWQTYQSEEFELKNEFDVNRLLEAIAMRGYHSEAFDLLSVDEQSSPNYMSATYVGEDPHENLTASGKIHVVASLYESPSYPKEYQWSISADESDMEFQWTLTGNWHGMIPRYGHGFESCWDTYIEITNIKEFEVHNETYSKKIMFEGIARTKDATLDKPYYKDELVGFDAPERGTFLQDLCITFEPWLYTGKSQSTDIRICFYADSADCVSLSKAIGSKYVNDTHGIFERDFSNITWVLN